MNNDIIPGSIVEAFDSNLYIDDIKTPLSVTLRKGVVVKRYGMISKYMLREHGVEASRYPDLVDIYFHHRPDRISKGHFTSGVKNLDT